MHWIFSDRLSKTQFSLLSKKRVLIYLVILIGMISFSACGRVYFPIELKTISRSDRSEKQQDNDVVIIPMTTKNINLANSVPYKRYIIEAGDLKEATKLVPVEFAVVQRFPIINDTDSHLIGIGDVMGYQEFTNIFNIQNANLIPTLPVNEDGLMNFFSWIG